jgi:uncharacterized protein
MQIVKNHKQELWLVLMVSLGASTIYSLLSLWRKLISPEGLAGSVTTINRPLAQDPWLDLASQLASISLSLVPVLLALYFLRQDAVRIGLLPIWKDLPHALGLAALIGIPGLGLYFLAEFLGLTSKVVPNALSDNWWTIPILLLAALRAGLQEEVIAVGFLMSKLKLISPTMTIVTVILISSVFRGSYHLYQGYSAFIGNLVMGVIFAVYFYKTQRVAPLVIAHTLINSVAFISYPLLLSA